MLRKYSRAFIVIAAVIILGVVLKITGKGFERQPSQSQASQSTQQGG